MPHINRAESSQSVYITIREPENAARRNKARTVTAANLLECICLYNPVAYTLRWATSSFTHLMSYTKQAWHQGALFPKMRKHEHLLMGAQVLCPITEKTIPYNSNRYIEKIINLNCKVKINGKLIMCRHLATVIIRKGLQNPSGKIFPHELFGSSAAILKNVSPDIEAQYDNLKLTACEKHIFATADFGAFLADKARRLKPGEKKWFLLESSIHAMAFELHYKSTASKDGHTRNRYVVRFFDPNRTNIKVRCEVTNPDNFNSDTYSLRNFINDIPYNEYFTQNLLYPAEQECIVYDCSDPLNPRSGFATLDTASSQGISGIMLWHLLKDGRDTNAILDIVKHPGYKQLSSEARKELFQAKCNDDTPGFLMALRHGHVGAILAYGALLKGLTESERAAWRYDLLSSKQHDGKPGLLFAFIYGHADAITAFGILLDELPIELRVKLLRDVLSVKADNDKTGLTIALDNGYTNVILALSALLYKLPAEMRAECLPELANTQLDNMSKPVLAKKKGHTEVVEAFNKLLEIIFQEQRDILV